MLEFTNRKKLTSLLFLTPIIWMSTGMLWDGDGDMRLVPIVLIVAVVSIALFRFEIVKGNFKNSFWIKLLLVNSLFGLLAYEIYGFDSRELRATLIVLFMFLFTPRKYYTKSMMQWFLLASSFSCLFYSLYYQVYIDLDRGHWPINAIPFATICGLILFTSIGLILTGFEGKVRRLLFLSVFLSLISLILTQSRGPLIAQFVVFSIFTIIYSYSKERKVVIFVLFCFILSSYLVVKLPLVQSRVESTIQEYHRIQDGDFGSSIGIRFQMIDIGKELWLKKPLVGYGKDIKLEFDRLEQEGRITPNVNRLISMTFHNGYLDKFVMYGSLGGGIFLTFLIYPIWLSRFYTIKNGSSLLWGPALFILICNFSDAPFINAQAAIYYMFIIGSVTMMLSNEREIV